MSELNLNYESILEDAVESINSAPSALRVRGINSPAYVLLGSQAFVSQWLLETFRQLSPQIGLFLLGATNTARLGALASKGTVSVSSTTELIANELRLLSPNGLEYIQTSPPTRVTTPTTLNFEAVDVGDQYNTNGSLTPIVDGWVISDGELGSVGVFSGGRDQETEEAYMDRAISAMTTKGNPLRREDWEQAARESIRKLNTSYDPIVRAESLPLRVDIQTQGAGCPNFYTAPEINIYGTRTSTTTLSEIEALQVGLELYKVAPMHTRVRCYPAVFEDIYMKVVVQSSNTNETQMYDRLNTLLKSAIRDKWSQGIIDQRYLLALINRVPDVFVCEDVWLGTTGVNLVADNILVGNNLPRLIDLVMVLLPIRSA